MSASKGVRAEARRSESDRPPPRPETVEAGLGWLLLGATVVAGISFAVYVVWPAAVPMAGALGVSVLLGAPFAVILTAGFLYARAGAWDLVAITFLLMAILGLGLWLQAA